MRRNGSEIGPPLQFMMLSLKHFTVVSRVFLGTTGYCGTSRNRVEVRLAVPEAKHGLLVRH